MKWYMYMSRVYDIFVDLVRDDKNIMFYTQLAQVHQFLLCPYSAYGIMRATKDDHPGARRNLFLQVGKIHHVVIVVQLQSIIEPFAPVAADRIEKRVVYRSLHYYLVARLCECPDK